jgi:hypothetical protein
MPTNKLRRCAIYTRKSSEEGLEQDFNSLDAQGEASEAFIKSQSGSSCPWQPRPSRTIRLRLRVSCRCRSVDAASSSAY